MGIQIIFALIFILFFGGCNLFSGNLKKDDRNDGFNYNAYMPINPISLPVKVLGINQQVLAGAQTAPENLQYLANNFSQVSIKEITADFQVNYISAGITTKGRIYKASIDYIKYFPTTVTLPLKMISSDGNIANQNKDVSLSIIIGVGLRANADFFANESNANISDIVSIGASAKANYISGTLSFQTMGIESKSISDSLPIPSELSSSAIQEALKTMATLKANIYDSNTKVTPQIIGIEVLSVYTNVRINDLLVVIAKNKKSIIDAVVGDLESRGIKFTLMGH